MSQIIVVKEPELEKGKISFTRDDFEHKCFYSAKFLSIPVKLEKSIFVDLLLDFSKPCSSSDYLTPAEICDVEESWREIGRGHSRRSADVNDFLGELKR